MSAKLNEISPQSVCVSLVDGNPDIRHARQLMLRSEKYHVRSYPTCAALLADPRTRDCSCIILDLEMDEVDGVDLLEEMRATGWRGKALLLDGLDPGTAALREAEQHGDKVLPRNVGDRSLLAAISSSIDRSWPAGTPLADA